jgi:methionyl-tRNA formyltransferase
MKKIKYIFFGSPEFAETVLNKLIDSGLPPMAVVVNPDRPVGRKKELTPVPVKLLAEKRAIKVFQPEKITDEFISEIAELKPEMFVVAAYAKIIPLKLIAIPPLGALGVHPSLLPLYRGASPIQSAILGGEKETGVTIYMMDERVDHGPVLAEKSLEIHFEETYPKLLARLAELGGELIAETLPRAHAKKIIPEIQREELVTMTRKFESDNAFISEDVLKSALSGVNLFEAELADKMIRALNPEPGVWTFKGGKRVKLLEAKLKNGRLVLKTIQIEGKTPQPAKVLFG